MGEWLDMLVNGWVLSGIVAGLTRESMLEACAVLNAEICVKWAALWKRNNDSNLQTQKIVRYKAHR